MHSPLAPAIPPSFVPRPSINNTRNISSVPRPPAPLRDRARAFARAHPPPLMPARPLASCRITTAPPPPPSSRPPPPLLTATSSPSTSCFCPMLSPRLPPCPSTLRASGPSTTLARAERLRDLPRRMDLSAPRGRCIATLGPSPPAVRVEPGTSARAACCPSFDLDVLSAPAALARLPLQSSRPVPCMPP